MNDIPKVEEMKVLIENIYNTSIKLNGQINISTLDDAANLAAYLFGFSSWMEYHSLVDKEKDFVLNEVFKFKNKKFKDVILTQEDFNNFLNINHLIEDEKSKKSSTVYSNITQSNMIPLEWIIGYKKDTQSKVSMPIGLLPENYIVNSSNMEHVNNFFKLKLEWLCKNKQSFYIFGIDDDNIINFVDNLYSNENEEFTLYQLGQRGFKIDPIKEAFENNDLESLVGINKTEESESFSILWIMIVRFLKDSLNYEWDSVSLLKSISLESLIEIMLILKDNNKLLYQLLSQYIYKKLGVKIDNDNFILNTIAQEKHYKQTYILREKLEKIYQLYKEGYFSHKTKVNLSQLIFNKDSALFLECANQELRKEYWNICNLTYINAHKQYEKILSNQQLDNKLFKVWSVWWGSNNKIQEDIAYKILKQNNTQIICAYSFSSENKLEDWYANFKQILFLRQFTKDFPDLWKNKALINTEYWEENLWFNNYDILKKIKSDEAFLWNAKNSNTPIGIDVFEFKKINLYLKNV